MKDAVTKVIFLGNGPLADAASAVLTEHFDIIFHARDKADLGTVARLKREHPDAFAILASFGAFVPSALLELFEPVGILNIHPSKLPEYRGPSPIETAILDGRTAFSVSIMKLAAKMDAGPIYYQTTLTDLPLDKAIIYQKLAETGANWLVKNLNHLPTPVPQNDENATFTHKFVKTDGFVDPSTETAAQILRKIVAFSGFPKVKMPVKGQNCIILAAHTLNSSETAPLEISCLGGQNLAIDLLQPENRRPMDAKSFLNGYCQPK